MSKPDPLSWTLLFKKHRTTVLLMLSPNESIKTAKEALLNALKSRGLTDINGESIPEDPAQVEFGVAVDKNDLEKGWTILEVEAGKKTGSASLQAADLRNGQPIAFRFRERSETEKDDLDIDNKDPGWDIVVPSLDDEEEEQS
ncbi:hypothetical protein ASPWEDRAFT_155259 [Aspergillus wentii DTO 134E9]|uniref:Uncharacterized protein n=1 Tax=Aspergillus wentii DTO 134E9 TaxID=1073089 RepID=A0A1L9RKL0_ASPWE|nr:uncharacterized protein ASPWEDRAFT_155259 [Aspergillus wentii DTO 134E9]KAI9924782.1 hypothetical protein MW887_006638 [Aspergillus wentii]OJJ35451.1 hypothetical protein ASPWEDRAFT_155259 [Aspergillus wentii DTO 134E9]